MHPRKKVFAHADRATPAATTAATPVPSQTEGFDPEIIQMSTPVGCPPFGRKWGPIPERQPARSPRDAQGPVPHAPHAPRGSIYRASRTVAAMRRCSEQSDGLLTRESVETEPEPSSHHGGR